MRELAVYDYKNYIENGTVGRRPSVRGIIIDKDKIAMVHSLKYDYYNTNPKSKNRQSLFFEP
ncbi:MAG: hypothetical protein J1E40_04705, partial [Oscillospiraceae bacterium]|nr:hypothetical protein [Oscillospiraceae bacterium]